MCFVDAGLSFDQNRKSIISNPYFAYAHLEQMNTTPVTTLIWNPKKKITHIFPFIIYIVVTKIYVYSLHKVYKKSFWRVYHTFVLPNL